MKRDHKSKKKWRQLEIVFPVRIAPPTFATPQAAYDFFTKHQDEFPDIDHVEPKDSDMDASVVEFGQEPLDVIAGVMSVPVIPGAREIPASEENVTDSQDVESSIDSDGSSESSDT